MKITVTNDDRDYELEAECTGSLVKDFGERFTLGVDKTKEGFQDGNTNGSFKFLPADLTVTFAPKPNDQNKVIITSGNKSAEVDFTSSCSLFVSFSDVEITVPLIDD